MSDDDPYRAYALTLTDEEKARAIDVNDVGPFVLPAELTSVRIFKRALSDEEIARLLADPDAEIAELSGPASDSVCSPLAPRQSA